VQSEVPTHIATRRVQDWTTQVSEDAEGVVSFRYRTKPDDPPDVQTIQKQMAIVAWQPGPNRIVQVPDTVSSRLRLHARNRSLQRATVLLFVTNSCEFGARMHVASQVRLPSLLSCDGPCPPTKALKRALGASQSELESLKDGEVRERTPARPQQRTYTRKYGSQQRMSQILRPEVPERQASVDDELAGTWETLQIEDGAPLVERRDVWGLADPVRPGNPLDGLRFDSS